jgi:hypothetical protein
VFAIVNGWRTISVTVVAPSWSGALEYAFVKIAGGNSDNTVDYYVDNLTIREAIPGSRLIYQKTLGPGVNPFGSGTTNPQGIYWIDCGGEKLYIERSRIKGTLLLLNPGSGSCIGPGPIHWSPAVAGYPALMVQADDINSADFTIAATTRPLGETENGVNYNPAGTPHSEFGTDADVDDIYPSEINGLIVVGDDVTFENDTIIRGQIIAGDDITSSGGALEVDYQPDSLLNPPPGFTNPATHTRPGSVRKTVSP